jgi:hypothetical protein
MQYLSDILFFFLAALGFEFRASRLLGRHLSHSTSLLSDTLHSGPELHSRKKACSPTGHFLFIRLFLLFELRTYTLSHSTIFVIFFFFFFLR